MPAENNTGRGYPELETLSTEELEALLRLDFVNPDGQEPDISNIMAITEVICKRDSEASNEHVDIDIAWQEFQKNHALNQDAGIEHDPSPHYSASIAEFPKTNKRPFHLRRLASATLVSALLVGILVTSASGVNLFALLARWSTETFYFATSKEQEGVAVQPTSDDPMYNLRETVATYTDLPAVPTWCPQGTVEQRIQVSEQEDRVKIRASFQSAGKELGLSITVYNEIPDAYDGTYEKDDTPVIEYISGGVTHYIISNLDNKTVVWTHANLECSISGEISTEELQQMVDSLYKEIQ